MTNLEKIRHATEEEIVRAIMNWKSTCQHCAYDIENCNYEHSCKVGIKAWLNSEVEE